MSLSFVITMIKFRMRRKFKLLRNTIDDRRIAYARYTLTFCNQVFYSRQEENYEEAGQILVKFLQKTSLN